MSKKKIAMKRGLLSFVIFTLGSLISSGQDFDPRTFAMFAKCIVSYEPEKHGIVVIRQQHQGFIASESADEVSLKNLTLFIDQPNRLECNDTGDNIEVVMYESFYMQYDFFCAEKRRSGIAPKTSFDLKPQNIVVINGIPQTARDFAKRRFREVSRRTEDVPEGITHGE